MPQRLAKTKKHRHLKTKKMGVRGKRSRENNGTTDRFPLEGDLPALRRGKAVKPESIFVPAPKTAAPTATKKPKAPAAKPART